VLWVAEGNDRFPGAIRGSRERPGRPNLARGTETDATVPAGLVSHGVERENLAINELFL